MNYITPYTPYVYLNKSDEDSYTVFMTVLHYQGQSASFSPENGIRHLGGTATLTIEINGPLPQNSNVPLVRFHAKHTLHPITKHGDDFNLETFRIDVEVSCNVTQPNNIPVDFDRKTKVRYIDADEESISLHNDIALHCPYLYLNNPFTEITNPTQPKHFKPYCLLFVKGLKFQPETSTLLQNEDGVFEQFLELEEGSPANDNEVEMVDPATIPGNSSEYLDRDDVNGYFTTQVNENSLSRKKRKGKLRNASADGNPTRFMG